MDFCDISYKLPDQKLKSEPSIAQTFKIEECFVSVGSMFVNGPLSGVERGCQSNVVYHGHPHAGVSLQTEDDDGGADEEDRYYPKTLR